MKILLMGSQAEILLPLIDKNLFSLVEANPDLIVTYGGDGALLGGERKFPGIPKLPIRDRRTDPLCPKHDDYQTLFNLLKDGKLRESKLSKLCGSFEQQNLIGINDVFIHNANPVSAIRYRVLIDGEAYGHEIVGDGVGVATVHGSTAYYRSITHSIFRSGIGLAFSNSTEVTNHLVLPEETEIIINITRGPAVLVADNNPEIITLKEGNQVKIRKITEQAVVLGHDIFMCPQCRNLRHPRD